MPAPSVNNVPETSHWKFVQKSISDSELFQLAKNIVAEDGKSIDNTLKNSVLSFLGGDKVQQWSDYWVTIIHTLGIGYVDDNKLYKTKQAEYIANGCSSEAFFLLWFLNFQFPFAETKHKEYKENKIVTSPSFIMLEALTRLTWHNWIKNPSDPFTDAYLTPEEVVYVLMPINSNSSYEIHEKVNFIIDKRNIPGFDYNTLKQVGHDTVLDNFQNRSKLYFEKSGILKYKADKKIFIEDWKHYTQCLNFLQFRRANFTISLDHEQIDRKALFEIGFGGAGAPEQLHRNVHHFDNVIDVAKFNNDPVESISSILNEKGIYFKDDFLERFLLSAKTKPFVILSGISGVGKSLLPRELMKILHNEDCRPIAVSPDWTDNTDMLGYFDASGKFIPGEFTNIVSLANQNRHLTYFVVLDEMNLAKVEYYFAQVLSVIESREFNSELGFAICSDHLFNLGMRQRLTNSDDLSEQGLASLKIPQNVVIVGTVNIDESTHPFSKKVLDRANVIEIKSVDLKIGLNEFGTTPPSFIPPLSSREYLGTATNLSELIHEWKLNVMLDAKFPHKVFLEKWIDILTEFNTILGKNNLNFGLRLRDEVCIYLFYAALRNINSSNANWDLTYIDHQLVQKVLTRIEGEEGEIEETLLELFKKCMFDPTVITDNQSILNYTIDSSVKFQLTASKLQAMLRALIIHNKPMVSFWTC